MMYLYTDHRSLVIYCNIHLLSTARAIKFYTTSIHSTHIMPIIINPPLHPEWFGGLALPVINSVPTEEHYQSTLNYLTYVRTWRNLSGFFLQYPLLISLITLLDPLPTSKVLECDVLSLAEIQAG